MAVLILIFFNTRRRMRLLLTEERLFLLIVFSDAFILVLDSLMWLLDGKAGDTVRTVNMLATVVYYIMNPVICAGWYFYVDYLVYGDIGHLKKMIFPMAIPLTVNLGLSVSSFFSGMSFYYDSSNSYHRGKLFFVMALISFFYLAYAWILSMVKRRLLPKKDLLPISFFMILPVIAGIIQSIHYGLSLVWPSVTISILIIFVHIQNVRLHTDYLTGLNNRMQLDRYMQQKVGNPESGQLAGLMIDIDHFKSINDAYGHNAGDQALIDTSGILQKTFRKNDFIARYGGDEFVVIMAIHDREDLQKAIERLNQNVTLFNLRKTVPYTISLSVGYDSILSQKDATAKEFIQHLDSLMYRDKHSAQPD